MIPEVVANIPRTYTALAEWGACMVFVLIVARRMPWLATAATMLGGLGALLAVQTIAGLLSVTLWIPGMLAAVATMFVLLLGVLRVTAVTAGYLTARAFVLAELTASIHWQLDRFYADAPEAGKAALLVLVYAGVLAAAWFVERRHMPRGTHVDVGVADLVSALAIAGATFGISNLSFVNASTPFSGRLGPEILYIRTLVDLCGFIALYVQHEVRRSLQTRRESEAMARLLTSQHDQYEISRRTIDEVNRKYHDMKHHLDAVRAEQDAQQRLVILDELETSIRDYGAQVRSGNAVLDAVLTGKQMYAREQGIPVVVVADGRLVDFVRPLDLTAIVGNALDNAFEATMRLGEREQRMVKFSLFAHDDFVMLRVENTFDGRVHRRAGRIVTRKEGEGHGYGLRNIEAAAEKYGGSVSLGQDDGWFSLRVLLPRRGSAQSS
ncbi:GHKL domain-containing protein [Microbacterium sp. cx-55]|uniref:sensor histidine kinase n=1 Tax=unclassified Microbacterium TaxID=2609290 RepID=UPI001CBFBF63|nr:MULTISPECIES: sensor histidine kinase [unclassified Microbacterium]MBZ4487747.1 GHKL domain-containing protein [Microbacterium sp. cx-55]MCC4909237.1 GHKL domain-containing protein [Microbacterium sp. cx-59]UGB34841.1 GHKL domain-containing protein [Microbacterium sp. cx-55]